ncbi:MAG: tyrosine-type recombinase/integrase [Acidimicrobiales bacterium]
MASIRETPHGTWEVHYRDPYNRQRSRSFRRKTDARRFANEVETDTRRGQWTPPEDTRRIFGEVAEDWFDWTRAAGRKPRTLTTYRGYLDRHILPVFGRLPITSVDRVLVRRFATDLGEGGLATPSVRKVVAVLRQILGFAEENRYVRSNPAANLRLSTARPKKEIRFLTVAEVEALAEAIETPSGGGAPTGGRSYPEYRLLVRFAAYTGLRAGEIGGLRVGDLDLERGAVQVARVLGELRADVRANFVELEYQGTRYKDLFIDSTKTDRVRTVPIPATVVDDLSRHAVGMAEDDFVFRSPAGGPLRHLNFYRRHFKPAVDAAGLTGCRFHDLRHSYASLLIAQGANPKTVMERLGHSTIQMTLNVYGHLFPLLEASITEALDAQIVEAEVARRRAALRPVTGGTSRARANAASAAR